MRPAFLSAVVVGAAADMSEAVVGMAEVVSQSEGESMSAIFPGRCSGRSSRITCDKLARSSTPTF